jgi:hypothetical protein
LGKLWYQWGVRAWVRAGDDRDLYEWRVFPGERHVVAVLRDRRIGKVVYAECGRYWPLDSLNDLQWRQVVMSFLKRAVPAAGAGGGGAAFPDAAFAKDYPALYEYMTAQQWPDGTTRKTSSVTLFCEDSQLKVCVTEKNDGTVLFAAGKTLKSALAALEGLLTSAETPWRVSGGGRPANGQKPNGRR